MRTISLTCKATTIDSNKIAILRLIQLARKLDRTDSATLRQIAEYFSDEKEYTLAAEIYNSINDMKALLHMYVGAQLWDEVKDVLSPFIKHCFRPSIS